MRHFLAWLLKLGLFGPLLLGIADSSFLFLPFGNDLLVVTLTARNHAVLPLYVLTASVGSALAFVARAIRFTIIGLLAIRFGRQILRIAGAPETAWIMLAFIVLCVIGSGFQVLQWIRRSRGFA